MKKTVSRYAHSLYSSFMAMLFAAGPHSLCFLILIRNQSCWQKPAKKQSIFVPLLQIDGPLDVVVLFPGKAPAHNVPRILNNHKGVRIKLRD